MARCSEGQVVRPPGGGRAPGGEAEQGAGEEDHREDGGGGDPDGEQGVGHLLHLVRRGGAR